MRILQTGWKRFAFRVKPRIAIVRFPWFMRFPARNRGICICLEKQIFFFYRWRYIQAWLPYICNSIGSNRCEKLVRKGLVGYTEKVLLYRSYTRHCSNSPRVFHISYFSSYDEKREYFGRDRSEEKKKKNRKKKRNFFPPVYFSTFLPYSSLS